jgi:hypothetical protein
MLHSGKKKKMNNLHFIRILRFLNEAEFKSNELINFSEEISRQHCIQPVAWL